MLALNPHLLGQPTPVAPEPEPVKKPGKKPGKKRKVMNRIETEFSMILERDRKAGIITRWDYEGMTLRWPDGMMYSPDFCVFSLFDPNDESKIQITFIEVKGPYSWAKDIVKFRAARAQWPMFKFEFWQKIDGGWQETR